MFLQINRFLTQQAKKTLILYCVQIRKKVVLTLLLKKIFLHNESGENEDFLGEKIQNCGKTDLNSW